jgi:hypothetical protein
LIDTEELPEPSTPLVAVWPWNCLAEECEPEIAVESLWFTNAIRYTPELASPSWSSAIDIGPALPGISTQAVFPLLTGTYMAKAVDSSGSLNDWTHL